MLKQSTVGECICNDSGCNLRYTNGVISPECVYDVNYAPICPPLMIQPLNGFTECENRATDY